MDQICTETFVCLPAWASAMLYFSVIGAVFAYILWPRKGDRKDDT